MYLIFDTETDGLPKNWKAAMLDLDNWPRVIQLAWQLYDARGELIMEYSSLIVPDGWEIPTKQTFLRQGMLGAEAEKKAKFWIDNGFTTERCRVEGKPIRKALAAFLNAYNNAEYLIAHNVKFDYNVLGAELLRARLASSKKIPRLCTMESSVDVCKIPGKYGYKWPKLEEVYFKFFRKTFDGAHDALADVKACAKVFFELKKRGLIC